MRKVKPSAPVPRRGDTIEVQTTGIAADGKAVGRLGTLVVFVSGALPGERVSASVEKVTSRYVVARVSEILDANPGRIRPACSAFGDCGGCQLMHARPELQLELRKNLFLDALATVAGVSDAPEPVLWPARRHLGYRNRGQYPVARQGGKIVCGFYASGSHRVVPVDRCPLHMEQVNTAVTCVRSWANAKGISAYDEVRHAGALRHVAVRVAPGTEHVQVVLVVKERPKLAHMDLLRRLRRRLASLSGLLVNINPRRTNVIFGRRFETLWGEPKLGARFMGLSLELPPASFFQVNTEQAERLFGRALDFIGNRPGKLADIYCGTGVTALLAAERADRVVGIDSDDAAIKAASANARLNGATNTEFMAGRAEALLPRLVAQGLKPDCIVLDPPRAGCSKEVLEAICSSGCERIAYVSCNPGTLARDLKYLLARGYHLSRLECFDMFPQTIHVEVLACLER